MDWRKEPELTEQYAQTYRCEVLVIGLGFAGSAAVRAAAEQGAKVIGLEAQTEENFTLFGRDFGHINSRFLASRGVGAVDPLDLFGEWMRRAGNRADPELVMTFCRSCGDAFDWYTEPYGTEGLKDVHVAFWPEGGSAFKEAERNGTNELNGYYFWHGTAQFPDPAGWPGKPTLPDCARANLEKARELGAGLHFGTRALKLLTEDGRVVGAAAESGGVLVRFSADKVILAAGDFSRDPDMVRDLCCDCADLLPEGETLHTMGRDGSGVRMGVWAGGQLESRPIPTMGGNGIVVMNMCNFGSVWFDQTGKRFCNEYFGGPELAGMAGNQHAGEELLLVFDEHMQENELTWTVPAHGMFDANIEGMTENLDRLKAYAYSGGTQPFEANLKGPFGRQQCYYGRTPEELAMHAGLSSSVASELCRSIRRYNDFCENGRDEDFGRDARLLDPLTDMLFLQRIPLRTSRLMLVTTGGLLTDGKQRVLDQSREPIPGLFATGNCCGRRFGAQYSTPIAGLSIGMAVTMGREAGFTAARRE